MISFIIPAHNEQIWIGWRLSAIDTAMSAVDVAHEVIVVDDASTDATGAVARRQGARVIPVAHRHQPGNTRFGSEEWRAVTEQEARAS